MVSQLIAMGMLVGAAFAKELTLDEKYAKDNFETAICNKFEEHKGLQKDLKLEDLVKTHYCPDKKKHLCLIHQEDQTLGLTCSAKNHDEFTEFKINEKFTLFGNEYKKITEIECKAAEFTYDAAYGSALRAMGTKKERLGDLEKVEGDHTNCLLVEEVEKKEEKKEDKKDDKKEDKKDDKKEDKKEEKKEVKVFFFTVKEKEYKTTEKVQEVEILGKKYKALFCGKDEILEKEAKAFEKAAEGGCCGCWVWAVVIIGVVGVGAGAWYVLKDDDVEEDEFADQYA